MTDTQIDSRFYDGDYFRSRYVDNPQPYQRLVRLLPHMNLGREDRLFDFGCGTGLMLKALTEHAVQIRDYCGIDFSSNAIEMAREEAAGRADPGFPCRFEQADVVAFARAHQGAASVACAMDFSEHVADDQWREFLRAIHACLDPCRGRLFLHTPNAGFVLEIMKKHDFLLRQFPDHIAVRSGADNARLLTEAGFGRVWVHHVPHYLRLLRPLHLLHKLPWLGRFLRARLFIVARP